MGSPTTTSPSPRNEELRRKIDRWRKTRKRRSPMPKELWDEAVALAQVDGVCPVSRAVGLDYKSLAYRVGLSGAQPARAVEAGRKESGGGGVEGSVSDATEGFFKLMGADLINAPPDSSEGTQVEFCGADGAKLTIRLPSGHAVDVRGLAEVFWGRPL